MQLQKLSVNHQTIPMETETIVDLSDDNNSRFHKLVETAYLHKFHKKKDS